MSENSALVTAIRLAVVSLRQIADTLEAALPAAPAQTAVGTSRASSEWDVVSDLPEGPGASLPPHRYNEVAQSLTVAPSYCRELGSRLGSTTVESEARVQRAWEAGLSAAAFFVGRFLQLGLLLSCLCVLQSTLFCELLVFRNLSVFLQQPSTTRFCRGSLTPACPTHSHPLQSHCRGEDLLLWSRD